MEKLLKLIRRGIAAFILLILFELVRLGYQLIQISTKDEYIPQRIFNISVEPNFSKGTHISMIIFFIIFFLTITFLLIKLIHVSRNKYDVHFFSNLGATKIVNYAKLVLTCTIFLCAISFVYEVMSIIESITKLKEPTAYRIGYLTGGGLAIIANWLPFFILSIFLLIIGQITKLGANFKQENDLTI